MKYDFLDMKRAANLPADINAPVEDVVARLFKCPELDAEVREARVERRHCSIEYSDQAKACILNFVAGICEQYFLVGRKKTASGFYIVEKRSVKNKNLSHSKRNN